MGRSSGPRRGPDERPRQTGRQNTLARHYIIALIIFIMIVLRISEQLTFPLSRRAVVSWRIFRLNNPKAARAAFGLVTKLFARKRPEQTDERPNEGWDGRTRRVQPALLVRNRLFILPP